MVRGEFGLDLPDMEWISETRRHLNARLLDALMCLGDYQFERGDIDGALVQFRRVVEWNALHEDAHREILRCLVTLGDRAGALRHYNAFAQLLQDELGTGPNPETVQLFEQIAAGDMDDPK